MSPPKFDDPLRRITALPGGPALVQVAQAALVVGALGLTACENEAETREVIDAIVDLGTTDAEIIPPMVPPAPDMGPVPPMPPPMPPPDDDLGIIPPMDPPADAAPMPDVLAPDATGPDAGVADAAVAADLPLVAPMPPPQDAALVIDAAVPDVGPVPPMPPPMPPPPPPQ